MICIVIDRRQCFVHSVQVIRKLLKIVEAVLSGFPLMTLTVREDASFCLDAQDTDADENKHESLILAQNERWRQA